MKEIVIKKNSINPLSTNSLADYLVNLGINKEDTGSFIVGPIPADEDKWQNLLHIQEGLDMLKQGIENKSKFFLQVDSDCDGFTSSAIFYSYFKERYPEIDITYRLHDGKQHGIVPSSIGEEYDFIICPDAGSMQIEQQEWCKENHKKLLVLDHHTMTQDNTSENIIIINNQNSPSFSNKHLSGAGVVYSFITGYDAINFNDDKHSKYLDLAALGIIADCMETTTLGNNWIIRKGLENIQNRIFQEMLTKQSFSIPNIASPTKIDIMWYIAPLVNGLIRSGAQEEKEIFFAAMLANNAEEMVESLSRGKPRNETIYQYAVRLAGNAKARQDNAKKKSLAMIETKVKNEGLDKNQIIIVVLKGKEANAVNQNITGLAAMEVSKLFNKPTLILREKQDEETNNELLYCGSGRSKGYYGFESFLQFLRNSKLCEYGEGHDNAFGAWIKPDNIETLTQYANEELKNINFEHEVVEVDYFHRGIVNTNILKPFADCNYIYGNGIPEPEFAFDLSVDPKTILIMGKDSTSMKFKKDGCDFIMFKCEDVIKEMQKHSEPFKVLIIGRPQFNCWNGNKYLQVKIDDIEIKEEEEKTTKRNLRDFL